MKSIIDPLNYNIQSRDVESMHLHLLKRLLVVCSRIVQYNTMQCNAMQVKFAETDLFVVLVSRE